MLNVRPFLLIAESDVRWECRRTVAYSIRAGMLRRRQLHYCTLYASTVIACKESKELEGARTQV